MSSLKKISLLFTRSNNFGKAKITAKRYLIGLITIFMSGFLLLSAPIVHAATPSLSLTANNDGDTVTLNVTGDPSSSVLFFYTKTNVGPQMSVLGNTNSGGGFSTSVSSSAYGIVSNSTAYIKTGGINGPQSPNVSWPYTQGVSTSTLTLSQTALLLNVGQTSTITAGASYLYLLSNSQPAIANINFNANQITVQALTYGSTSAKICVVGSTTNCATLSVVVQNSGAQQLTFSQNNFSIFSGQNITVSVTGGSGVYTITNNSNANAVQASLNGSAVNLTGGSTNGASSITVCTTDMNSCGIINANSSTVNSTAVSLSQTNPVVPIGQSTTVTIYGGTGTNFYVSSNSNPSVVQANVNNNILTLIGNSSTGAATISVCAYAGSCASLTANVSNATTGGGMSLSQSAISILAGQSSNITIFGGSTPYNISSTNSNSANIFNGNISGNILTVYGVNPGAVTINICSSLGCVPLAITINSTTSSTNPPAFSQNNVLLNAGQQATVYVSGTGSFYVANNLNPTAATAQISASTATVYALASGSTNISICQSGGQCSTLYVTVNSSNQSATFSLSLPVQSVAVGSIATFTASAPGSATPSYYLSDSFSGTTISNANINTSGVFNWTPAAGDVGVHSITVYAAFPAPGGSLSATAQITVTQNIVPTPTPAPQITYYNFLRFLGYGDTGDDVLLLQKLLVGKGFLTATPSGHYGPATIAAIKKFQEANGINQTGNVGSLTKAALNKIPMSTSGSTDLTKQQQISAIEQAIQQLLAQLAQIRGQ